MKNQMDVIKNALSNIADNPNPTLGLDIDGCIDEAPIFFQMLSAIWPGDVIIISYRKDMKKAVEFLKNYNIRYDDVVLVNALDAKAKVIEDKGVMVYFDDQPEVLKNIPSTVNVMLVRNEGNFDFEKQKWMLSDDTGMIV